MGHGGLTAVGRGGPQWATVNAVGRDEPSAVNRGGRLSTAIGRGRTRWGGVHRNGAVLKTFIAMVIAVDPNTTCHHSFCVPPFFLLSLGSKYVYPLRLVANQKLVFK